MKKSITLLLAVCFLLSGFMVNVSAATIKLNKSKLTLFIGDTYTLKLKNAPKDATVTWKSSKKSVATVDNKGVVTAKKKGKTTITAKYGDTTYKCKVTIKKKAAFDIMIDYIKANYNDLEEIPYYKYLYVDENDCIVNYYREYNNSVVFSHLYSYSEDEAYDYQIAVSFLKELDKQVVIMFIASDGFRAGTITDLSSNELTLEYEYPDTYSFGSLSEKEEFEASINKDVTEIVKELLKIAEEEVLPAMGLSLKSLGYGKIKF